MALTGKMIGFQRERKLFWLGLSRVGNSNRGDGKGESAERGITQDI